MCNKSIILATKERNRVESISTMIYATNLTYCTSPQKFDYNFISCAYLFSPLCSLTLSPRSLVQMHAAAVVALQQRVLAQGRAISEACCGFRWQSITRPTQNNAANVAQSSRISFTTQINKEFSSPVASVSLLRKNQHVNVSSQLLLSVLPC